MLLQCQPVSYHFWKQERWSEPAQLPTMSSQSSLAATVAKSLELPTESEIKNKKYVSLGPI